MTPRIPLLCMLSIVATGWALPAQTPALQADYDKHVKPYFAVHCFKCHGEKKPKGDFRLDNLPLDFSLAKNATHWTDVMDRLNAGTMPPENEKRPDAKLTAAVVEWIAKQFAETEAVRLAKRAKVTHYRLSREEYAFTIRDLLGVNFDPAGPTGLADDDAWHGFERIGSVLSLAPSHVEKYFAAAETILGEAFPDPLPPKTKPAPKIAGRKLAMDIRGGGLDKETLIAQGVAEKIREPLWPSHMVRGAGPGRIFVPGDYRCRIQVSGLKPTGGLAPHLKFYVPELDRVLIEQDVVAPEDAPIVLEFQAHLPAGAFSFFLMNSAPGPSVLPRSGRSDARRPFFSLKDPTSRAPWQLKLTDEAGAPLWPFLIVDWVEWDGPLENDGIKSARAKYLPQESGNLAQARAALTRFAERAFRRPLQSAETDRLMKLVEKEIASGEKFDAAVKTGLLAIMCSKDFLYLVEGSTEKTQTTITPWELAARLSYFLWSSLPDETLIESARDDSLSRPDVLKAQVKRMLADPKAQRFAESFPKQWLQLRHVGMFPPDKKLYPDYDAYLEKSMVNESTAFFREVLDKNLSLREFLDSDWTMLNARLALHYGIANVEADRFQRVALRPEDHRGGLLTHASVLSLTSDGQRHRPVHRGKWILESIFGKPPPPPPANVDAIEPTPSDKPKATLRMKLDAHKSNVNCAACHRKIDPLGLAFDNYDAIGRWRTIEMVTDGAGDNPKIDASGELADGRKFADSVQFRKLLVADIDEFGAAFTEKLATYALRRTMTIDDRVHLAAVAKQSKAADYRLGALIEALVLSELFQRR